MSIVTKTAFFSVLEGDPTLVGMLAADPRPNSNRPAIFGSWRGNNPTALPQLVVMQADQRPDPSEMLSGHIFHEVWHFEGWCRTQTDVHTQIVERVQALLHEQRFVLGGGLNLKYLTLLSSVADGYDQDLRENFAIQVYELVYSA